MQARHLPNRIFSLGVAGLSLMLLASCAPPPAPAPVLPPPPPKVAHTPPPRPSLPPRPALPPLGPRVDWRDAPITPGDWRWTMAGGQSVARFADGLLVLRCDRARKAVTLVRRGTADLPVPMTVITSSLNRPLSGTPQPGTDPGLVVTLPSNDPLLDALAFSRGRFAVETMGLPTLYVPSWAEVGRVIEDCR